MVHESSISCPLVDEVEVARQVRPWINPGKFIFHIAEDTSELIPCICTLRAEAVYVGKLAPDLQKCTNVLKELHPLQNGAPHSIQIHYTSNTQQQG